MPKLLTIAAAVAAGALLVVAPTHARISELGETAQPATPSCPDKPCLAVARTTGYQVKVGTERDIFTAPRRGKVVAWSITLAEPSKKQVAYFNSTFGGKPSAGVTVLRPGERLTARVISHSPQEQLAPYLGETVQFPLDRSLTVRKGDVLALTVPTWAPALAVGFGNDTSWRATRGRNRCEDLDRQTAQTETGVMTDVRCLYRTARLTYSVTFISSPRPKKRSTR